MELKLLANTEPRKKFHMTRKLKKAVVYAEELNNLCEMDRVDARTKLESQVGKNTRTHWVRQKMYALFEKILQDDICNQVAKF